MRFADDKVAVNLPEPFRRRGSTGFSLLELLAVVGIILVLAALLFPASQQVASRARAAVCLGNLRQISAAVTNYEADNNGFIPPIQVDMRDAEGKVVSTRWWIEINRYLKYKGVPTNPDWTKPPVLTNEEKTYVCPGNPRKASRGGAYVNYTGVLNASGNTYISYLTEARRKVTSFQAPLSQLPYLFDGYASANYASISPVAVDLYVSADSAKAAVNISHPEEGIFKPLHGPNINILYLDGHVSPVDICVFAATVFNYGRL